MGAAVESSVAAPERGETPPANSTALRRLPVLLANRHLAIASVACAAAATVLALVFIVWISTLLLRQKRRPVRWRPRPPPRGQVPSPPPSAADDGYLKPRYLPRSPSSHTATGSEPSEPQPAIRPTGHTYLLVLEDDAEIRKGTSTKQYSNSNISFSDMRFDEPGYLPMRRYPSVFKILHCRDDIMSQDTIKDTVHSHAQKTKRLPQTFCSGIDKTSDNGYQEMSTPKDTSSILTCPDVLQTSLSCNQEYVKPNSYCNGSTSSKGQRAHKSKVGNIQNRNLPPPPRQNKPPLKKQSSTASDQVLIS